MKKKGFTIVELLMVIGIISVLITMTTSAVSGSMKRARTQRANAICTLVEQGIATYYAQKDEWPLNGLEDKTLNADENGNKNAQNKTTYLLEASEVRTMIKTMIEEMKKDNGVVAMDVSGLYVSKSTGEKNANGYGMDFMDAVRGTKRNPSGIRLNLMYFGYPDPESGKFRRFKMIYSPSTDKVTVSQQ